MEATVRLTDRQVMMTPIQRQPGADIAVIGAGDIGLSWARLCRRQGYRLTLCDRSAAQLLAAEAALADEVGPPIMQTTDLPAALKTADLVLECVPERRDVKQTVYDQWAASGAEQSIYASSSSGIPISQIAGTGDAAGRALVAHPINPPAAIALVEVCPGPQTDPDTVETMIGFLRKIGKKPVLLNKEILGFAANRFQLAILREAADLVGRGIVAPEAVDAIFRDGLARRWVLSGPCRTFHLNRAASMADYFADIAAHLSELVGDLAATPELNETGLKAIIDYEDDALDAGAVEQERRQRDALLGALDDWLEASKGYHP